MSDKFAVWLHQPGPGQYLSEFREHDIRQSLLSELTDSDLKEADIVLLGQRKVMIKASDALRQLKQRSLNWSNSCETRARSLHRIYSAGAKSLLI